MLLKEQSKINWPNNHDFAFTIFDDTDFATLRNVKPAYDFLEQIGLKTTKSVWTLKSKAKKVLISGETCEDRDYLNWLLRLKEKGFEIALHNVTNSSSIRKDTIYGIEKFNEYFGHYPFSFANHADCEESIYWGESRVTGIYRFLYFILKYKNVNRFKGHIEGNKYFWGDICKEKIKYVRNFTFSDINTLKACPIMPYSDPLKPYVNYFFCASNGADVTSFNRLLSYENQDRLEEERGACIVYTHLGDGFTSNSVLNKKSKTLLKNISEKNGWFCTVTELLNFLISIEPKKKILTKRYRKILERRWFIEKAMHGSY